MSAWHIVLGALLCALTCFSAGLVLIRVFKVEMSRLECLVLGYIIGAALVSTLTLALGFVFLLAKGIFLAISTLAVAALWHVSRWLRNQKRTYLGPISWFWKAFFIATFTVYGGIYVRHALAPERSPDALTYHLGLVNLWNHAHGLPRVEDFFGAMPHGIEMLYLFAFSIGRHSAAALVHLSFLLILPFLMLLYGKRFGNPTGALFAAVMVFITPLVGWDGSVAYNDVALAAVAFGAIYLLQVWRHDQRAGYLALSGLLAGFAFAIKYTGVFVGLFVAGAVLWELRRASRLRIAKALLVVGGTMAMMPFPYLLRNWVWFDDPVAPFGAALFPNRYFQASVERQFIKGNAHLNGIKWREIPRELTLGGPKLPSNLGPVYLPASLAAFGFLWPESRLPLIAASVIGLAYVGNKDPRFLIPALPFVCLAMAFVLCRLFRVGLSRSKRKILLFGDLIVGLLMIADVVLCWPSVVQYLGVPRMTGPFLDETTWSVALRQVPEERYLSDKVEEYDFTRGIESHVPDGQIVFAPSGGVSQSYTARFILDNWHSAEAEKAKDLLYGNLKSATEPGRRWSAEFREHVARGLRIVQNGKHDGSWMIGEISLWHGSERVAPSPKSKWHSSDNPWDIGLSLDRLEATRWISREPIHPGMSIEVDIDPPQLIDRLEVSCNDSQWFSNMDAMLIVDHGQCVRPISEVWRVERPVDLRRQSAQALKRMGIRFIVISKSTWNAEAFLSEPNAWGMRKVLSAGGSTLYEIKP